MINLVIGRNWTFVGRIGELDLELALLARSVAGWTSERDLGVVGWW